MTIRITKFEDESGDRTILRVEGKLHADDAEIVEQIFEEIRGQNRQQIEINLAAVSFIGGGGAAVLKRIEACGGLLTGLDFFIREVIESHDSKILENGKIKK